MFKFLFLIAGFFFLLVFLLGFSVIRTFKRMLFGNPRSEAYRRQTTSSAGPSAGRNEDYSAASRKKLFTKDEGEYVEYEEVKE